MFLLFGKVMENKSHLQIFRALTYATALFLSDNCFFATFSPYLVP